MNTELPSDESVTRGLNQAERIKYFWYEKPRHQILRPVPKSYRFQYYMQAVKIVRELAAKNGAPFAHDVVLSEARVHTR